MKTSQSVSNILLTSQQKQQPQKKSLNPTSHQRAPSMGPPTSFSTQAATSIGIKQTDNKQRPLIHSSFGNNEVTQNSVGGNTLLDRLSRRKQSEKSERRSIGGGIVAKKSFAKHEDYGYLDDDEEPIEESPAVTMLS